MPDSKKIKRMMSEQGITQAELCRRSGIKPSNMSYIVNDDHKVKETTLMRLCNGLGCKAEDIALDV